MLMELMVGLSEENSLENHSSEAVDVRRFNELETVIERGQQTFVEVGLALAEIRDSRLYREDFATFEEYCNERWGWTASRSRKLISSAEAVAEMQSGKIFPPVANAGQASELAKIKDPEVRAQVWQQVNEMATEVEATVTAKLINQAVALHTQEMPTVEAVAECVEARQKHIEEVKNDPRHVWADLFYEMSKRFASIRQNGGIQAMATHWNSAQQINVLGRMKELQQSLETTINELEGAIQK